MGLRFFKNKKGFTLVEMLVVVALFLILAGLTIPIGMRFFATQNLTSFSYVLAETMRRTRSWATMQKEDSDWGVYIGPKEYIVFKGPSFSNRNPSWDEIYELPMMVKVKEKKEIVFEKMTGLPSKPVSVTLSNNYQSNVISVSDQGKINLSLDVSLASD